LILLLFLIIVYALPYAPLDYSDFVAQICKSTHMISVISVSDLLSIVPPLYASLAVSLYFYMICTLVGYIQLSQSMNSSPHLVSVCHWFRHSYITTYKICSSLKYFLEAGLVFICSRPELISAQILLTHHTSTTLEHWVPQAAHCKASLSHDPIV